MTLGLLVGICPLVQAVPRAHGSASGLVRLFGPARSEAGYLAVVGVPPLRWLERAAPPPVEQPLITLLTTDQPSAVAGAAASPQPGANDLPPPAVKPATGNEPPKPPAVRPEDFLPFFERGASEPAPPAAPDDGQRFVPAHATLPTSSAEYNLK
jgi:hypothetical protein